MTPLLKLLACPRCKGPLDELLRCAACALTFERINGVPILVDMAMLDAHGKGQIKYFEAEEYAPSYVLEPWQSSYIERFLEHFMVTPDMVVVDAGGGSGYMALELAKRGAQVIMCDLTLKSVARVARLAAELGVADRLLAVCASAEELPFASRVADVVISNAVLEHLPREAAAIAEINRVAKAHAGLFITVPLRFKFVNPLLIPLNMIHDRRIGHLRRYDERSLLEKFSGWSLKRSYYTGHFAKVVKTVVNMVWPLFSLQAIEKQDASHAGIPYGASNIIGVFTRG